ncbi:hypothetical protein A2U01_0009907, partial [Trifolium medium]|nr:hypothetical protein [Trifolium medium]
MVFAAGAWHVAVSVGMASFADEDKADTVVWDMGMKNVKVHIGMAKPKDGWLLQDDPSPLLNLKASL